MRLLSFSSRGTAIVASFLLLLAPAYADEPGDQPGGAAQQGVETEAAAEPAATMPRGIEEIVITANKQESKLQATPLAVSAFSNSDYEDFQIDRAEDIMLLVPSMSFFFERLYIRGVGRTQNSLGMDPGVAMYNDGVYRSDLAVLFGSSLGTERLEVMRGPQGTIYGRNATGGAVNFVSQRPTQEYSVQGRANLGNYATREYGLLVGGPITDWLRVSAQISDESRDGWQDNVGSGRDLRAENRRFYELQVEADLSEDVSLWVKWNKSLWDPDSGLVVSPNTRLTPYITDNPFGGTSGAIVFNPQADYPVPNPGERDGFKSNVNDTPKVRLQDTWSITAELSWDAGPVQVKYLYGWQTYDWNYRHGDWDTTDRTDGNVVSGIFDFNTFSFVRGFVPGANRQVNFIREHKTYYSHELQLHSDTDDRFQWQAGLYYYNEEIDQPLTIYVPDQASASQICNSCAFPTAANPFGLFDISDIVPNVNNAGGHFTNILYYQKGDLKSEAYSGHVELYYDLTETVRLTAGGRYSYDHKRGEEIQESYVDPLFYGVDYTQDPNVGTPGDDFFAGILPPLENCCFLVVDRSTQRTTDHWNAMTGRLILDWTPDDDTLMYAMYNVGYKSGGFRLGAIQPNPTFKQEKVNSYEVGLKKTFLDKRVLVNTAAYWYWYKNMQVLTQFQGANDPFPLQQVVNAPRTKFYGYEVEAKISVTDNFFLSGNYSYNFGEFTRFCCALDLDFPENGLQDLKGNDTI